MTARLVIDIKPHRYGWTCAHGPGEERVFILKTQAIRFAQQQCVFLPAEIRICDRHGAVERRLMMDACPQAMSA